MSFLQKRSMLVVLGLCFAMGSGPSFADALQAEKSAKSSYYEAVLASKPEGYWRLGESANDKSIRDSSGHRRHGLRRGAVVFGTAGAIAGDPDKAMTFDGDSYIEVASHPAFSQPTSGKGLTVEVWMYPEPLDFADGQSRDYVHWLGKGNAGKYEWGLRFYTKGTSDPKRSNRTSAYIWNSNGGEGAGAYFLYDLQPVGWVHVVACFEPGDARTMPPAGVKIYQNGVLKTELPHKLWTSYNYPGRWEIVPKVGTSSLRIGKRDDEKGLIGRLDEVSIYGRVLPDDEIKKHYEAGAEIKP